MGLDGLTGPPNFAPQPPGTVFGVPPGSSPQVPGSIALSFGSWSGANFIAPGGLGLSGSGGDPRTNLAAKGSCSPVDAVSSTIGSTVNNFTQRNPKLRWLNATQFLFASIWEDATYSDNTAKYVAVQKGTVHADNSVTMADPVMAVTEADYGSGHHAINEYFMEVDQTGVIWIGYSRTPYGAAALAALTAFDTQTLYVKSVDGGQTWSAPLRFDMTYINQLLNGTPAQNPNVNTWSNDGTNYTFTTASGDPFVSNQYIYFTGVTGAADVVNTAFRITRTGANAYTLTAAVNSTTGVETAPGHPNTPAGGVAHCRAASLQISGSCLASDGSIMFTGYWRDLPSFGSLPSQITAQGWTFACKTVNGFASVTAYVPVDFTNAVYTTNNPIEPDIAEYTPGSFRIWCRGNGNGSAGTYGRVMLSLNSGDTTIKNPIFTALTDSVALGGIGRLGDGRLVAIHGAGRDNANTASVRAVARIMSPLGKSLFARTLRYSVGRYSAVAVHPDGEQLLFAWETAHSSTVPNNITEIGVARSSVTALLNSAGTLDEFIWDMDERAAGLPATIVSGSEGACMIDRGPLCQHGTMFGSPTYANDGNGGITFHSATSDYAILSNTNDPAFSFDLTADDSGSFTIEGKFKTTAGGGGTTAALIGNSDPTGNNKGFMLRIGGTGELRFQVSDGTAPGLSTIPSTAVVNDGNDHQFVVSRNVSTQKLTMAIDGVAVTPVTDTSSTAAGSISPTAITYLDHAVGTITAPAADVTWRFLRVVRGIPASNFPATYVRTTKKYLTAPTPRANSPRSIFSASNLLLHAFDQDGWGVFGAKLENPSQIPPYVGMVCNGQIDASTKGYFGVGNAVPSAVFVRDPLVGGCWHTVSNTGIIALTLDSRTQADFSFLQQGGVPWTIGFRFNPNNSIGGAGIIFSTKALYGSGHNGLQLVYDEGTRRVYTTIQGTNTLADDFGGMPQLTVGQWAAIFISGTGNAASPISYRVVTPIVATQALPTLPSATTTANFTPGGSASVDSALLFSLVDGYVADFFIVNQAMASILPQLQQYCTSG